MAANSRERRTCMLVLGVHRSGTSAVTRVINLLGAALPKNLMAPSPNNNEAGFWEPKNLWLLHDQMLAEAGSQWDDWRKLDLGVLPPERLKLFKSEIQRMIEEEYGDAPIFVLKDPRICRFVPLYQDILGGMGIDLKYVLVHRHPFAVEASLKVRDQMPEACSRLLWLRYVLDSEKATRGCTRKFLSYEALMGDDGRHVNELAAGLAVTWPEPTANKMAEIKSSLRQELQHQKDNAGAPRKVALADRWLQPSWLALEEAMNTGKEQVEKFEAVDQALSKAQETAARTDFSEASALAVVLVGEQIAIAARDTQIAALNAELVKVRTEFQTECARLNEALEHTRAETSTVREHLEALYRSRSWRMTAPFRRAKKNGSDLIDRIRSRLPGFVRRDAP